MRPMTSSPLSRLLITAYPPRVIITVRSSHPRPSLFPAASIVRVGFSLRVTSNQLQFSSLRPILVDGWNVTGPGLFVRGQGWDFSTSVFTAPETGNYFASAMVIVTGAESATFANAWLTTNAAQPGISFISSPYSASFFATAQDTHTLHPAGMLHLKQGDQLRLMVEVDDSFWNIGAGTHMSVVLLD
eukprot:TRINITY_DN12329_c0_g1_i10.p4 TRINITY_DN12329_c0_g1~~TRINITY_DN12329_c0_g1_i10.p4  ORF type:complete len:187 (+),score=16.23 TRINITY_DN12329_c0_g1_i10:1465-2025(+)